MNFFDKSVTTVRSCVHRTGRSVDGGFSHSTDATGKHLAFSRVQVHCIRGVSKRSIEISTKAIVFHEMLISKDIQPI